MFSVRYELTLVFKGSNSLLAASPAALAVLSVLLQTLKLVILRKNSHLLSMCFEECLGWTNVKYPVV